MHSRIAKPHILVSSNARLFESFFPPDLQDRLTQISKWSRLPSRTIDRKFLRLLRNAEGLITTWDSPAQFSEDLLEWAPQLRVIAHCGGSVKTRFARPLFERLTITNAASPMARHVAELAVAFLLYFARDIDRCRAMLRRRSNGLYRQVHLSGGEGDTILDSQVGLIGYGLIGRAIAKMLTPFGVQLRVYDPYASTSDANASLRFCNLEQVLTSSRFLLIAAALTDETRGLLDRRCLLMLPPQAVVINVARGGLLDLDALTELVLQGRLRCALDVTDPLEPLPVDHPLRRACGAILTPHIGAVSRPVRREITSIILADLERFFAGGAVENRVTTEMLDRMA